MAPLLSNRSAPLLLGAALIGGIMVSLLVGRYPVSPETALRLLAGKLLDTAPTWPAAAEAVLLRIRLPRIAAAIEVGAALAGAGAAFQGTFRNPLVSPDILGVAAGAGFGAALAILCGWPPPLIQGAAFGGGLTAVGATCLIGQYYGEAADGALVMILAGVIIGTVFTAFLSLAKFAADPANALPAITFWLMGSLASVGAADAARAALPVGAGLAGLLLLRWRLNLLCCGDEEAKALGVAVGRLRLLVIFCATLSTAAAVAISGMIGLVGLVVPFLARLLVGPDYRVLLPCCLLLGGLFLLLVDDLARLLLPAETPLGILTSLLGAPVFLLLLGRTRRGWA